MRGVTCLLAHGCILLRRRRNVSKQLVKAPVYQQLNDVLRGLLRGGEFREGDRFLTARQVAERFEVSRAPANTALSNLVSEGLLEFRKGLGTFVAPNVVDVDLGLLVSFTARAEARGRTPTTRVLRFDKRKARDIDADVADKLGLAAGDAVFDMERLRLADDEPVIVEHRIVVAAPCPGLTRKTVTGSLYGAWTGQLGLIIGGATQTIRAVASDEGIATQLHLPARSPCLVVNAIGYLADGRPLWWEHTVYRGDAYEFQNHLGTVGARRGQPGGLHLVTPEST